MPGNVIIQNIFDELGVGIDHRHAVAGGDIACKNIPQERALAGTRAAEECQVPTPRIRHDINFPAFVESIFTAANEHGMERHKNKTDRATRL